MVFITKSTVVNATKAAPTKHLADLSSGESSNKQDSKGFWYGSENIFDGFKTFLKSSKEQVDLEESKTARLNWFVDVRQFVLNLLIAAQPENLTETNNKMVYKTPITDVRLNLNSSSQKPKSSPHYQPPVQDPIVERTQYIKDNGGFDTDKKEFIRIFEATSAHDIANVFVPISNNDGVSQFKTNQRGDVYISIEFVSPQLPLFVCLKEHQNPFFKAGPCTLTALVPRDTIFVGKGGKENPQEGKNNNKGKGKGKRKGNGKGKGFKGKGKVKKTPEWGW